MMLIEKASKQLELPLWRCRSRLDSLFWITVTAAISGGGIQQGNQARLDAVGLYLENCQRDRQFETPRAGASRVHV